MADRVLPGPVDSAACIREAVCVHTKKIFDSCSDKDCPFYNLVMPWCFAESAVLVPCGQVQHVFLPVCEPHGVYQSPNTLLPSIARHI